MRKVSSTFVLEIAAYPDLEFEETKSKFLEDFRSVTDRFEWLAELQPHGISVSEFEAFLKGTVAFVVVVRGLDGEGKEKLCEAFMSAFMPVRGMCLTCEQRGSAHNHLSRADRRLSDCGAESCAVEVEGL